MHRELRVAMTRAGSGHVQEALTSVEQLLRIYGRSDIPECEGVIASAMYNQGVLLRDLGRRDEAVSVWQHMEHRFAKHHDPAVTEELIRALLNSAACLRLQGAVDDALRGYQRAADRAADHADMATQHLFGLAMLSQASLLLELQRYDAAAAACEPVIKRFAKRTELPLFRALVTALGNKAEALAALGRHADSLAASQEAVRVLDCFAEAIEFLEEAAVAQLRMGVGLIKLGKLPEAVAAFEVLIERFEERCEPEVKRQVSKARLNRALTLRELDRPRDSVAAFADAVRGIGPSQDEVLIRCVNQAFEGWADRLRILGWTQGEPERKAEEARFDRAMATMRTQLDVIDALARQAQGRGIVDRIELYREMAELALQTPGIDPLMGMAVRLDEAAALIAAERYEETADVCSRVATALGDRRDQMANVLTARALDTLGLAYVRLERFDEAERALQALVERFSDALGGEVNDRVLRAQELLARLRRRAAGPPPTMLSLREIAHLDGQPQGTPVAHYVHAELQRNPPLLMVEYAASDAAKVAEGITGTAMLLSLIKRIKQEQGLSYRPPELMICFPHGPDSLRLSDPDCEASDIAQMAYGTPPQDAGGLRDANYDLLAEALGTFGLSLDEAMECTHIAGVAGLLDYRCETTSVRAGGPVICRYLPKHEVT